MKNMKTLLLLVVFATLCLNKNGVILAAKFPPGVEFCRRSDSNFAHCVEKEMTKALHLFKDGVPELGIPRLEPFEIPKLEITGDSSSTISLNQKYTNMLTYGISISKVYDGKFVANEKDCHWDFMVLTPHSRVEADYEINGKLLVFPIKGHGKSRIDITNLRNHHQAWCELYQKKGKTYARVTKYQMDMQGDQIAYNFENVVPGNKQISDEIAKTLNENSQQIFKELKFGFEDVWSKLHLQTVNNVFSKIPIDEIFPE